MKAALLALTLMGLTSAHAADLVVPFNFAKSATDNEVRFAESRDVAARSDRDGTWTVTDGEAVWTFTIEAPGAVGLGAIYKADGLPSEATLQVGKTLAEAQGAAAAAVTTDRRRVISTLSGDQMALILRVPGGIPQGVFQITSLQGAWRNPFDPAAPQAKSVQPKAGGDLSACAVSYQCALNEDPDTYGDLAKASAYIVVANEAACSATWVADATGNRDRRLLLTALHCEGSPVDDAEVTQVYSSYIAGCGADFYDKDEARSKGVLLIDGGMVERMRHGDTWLMEYTGPLSALPASFRPFLMGWDATTDLPQDGSFGAHHGGGDALQLVVSGGYRARARDFNSFSGVPYFEGNVSRGLTGPGASGHGLVDGGLLRATIHGSYSEGSDARGCPTLQVLAYPTLAGAWSNGAPATSLKAWLDPANTGRLTTAGVDSQAAPTVSLNASSLTAAAGSTITLSWSSSNAASCAASGAWTGTKALSGSEQIAVGSAAGSKTYTLTCENVARTVNITVTPAGGSTGGGSNGGGGGGGSMGFISLLGLGFGAIRRHRRANTDGKV